MGGGIGTQEIFIILLIGLIIFGAKKLPEIARGLGKGLSEFKKAARDVQYEITREIDQVSTAESAKEPLPPESQELTETESDQSGSDERVDASPEVGSAPEADGDRDGSRRRSRRGR